LDLSENEEGFSSREENPSVSAIALENLYSFFSSPRFGRSGSIAHHESAFPRHTELARFKRPSVFAAVAARAFRHPG
jgi:hypothetical protein